MEIEEDQGETFRTDPIITSKHFLFCTLLGTPLLIHRFWLCVQRTRDVERMSKSVEGNLSWALYDREELARRKQNEHGGTHDSFVSDKNELWFWNYQSDTEFLNC